MTEVYPNLFVGSDEDFKNWSHTTLHCAKEPWHRRAVGYTTRGAPQGPEYLVARRDQEVFLNLIDGGDLKFIDNSMICFGLNFITEVLEEPNPILVHCNEGKSRAPSIALLWLHRNDERFDVPLIVAEYEFRKLYRNYLPKKGIHDFIKAHWND